MVAKFRQLYQESYHFKKDSPHTTIMIGQLPSIVLSLLKNLDISCGHLIGEEPNSKEQSNRRRFSSNES